MLLSGDGSAFTPSPHLVGVFPEIEKPGDSADNREDDHLILLSKAVTWFADLITAWNSGAWSRRARFIMAYHYQTNVLFRVTKQDVLLRLYLF